MVAGLLTFDTVCSAAIMGSRFSLVVQIVRYPALESTNFNTSLAAGSDLIFHEE